MSFRHPVWLVLLVCVLAACEALSPATPTPTPTPTDLPTPTATPTVTPTATSTALPSASPTATTVPSSTPTPLPTLTPTTPATATSTPQPTVVFSYDNWQAVEAPSNILTRLNEPLVAFVNTNDRDGVGDVRTPQPATNVETLYYATAAGDRIAILQLDASTGTQIYLSPNGDTLAYFRQGASDATTGLYVVDLEIGISGRILALPALAQRGIPTPPVWSPDGTQLAVALATGYDMDIYTVGSDGSNPRPVTASGAYEFYPAWSPDGTRLAFVSDRATCPSWRPGERDTCDGTGAAPPFGGQIYVLELATGAVSPVGDQFVTEAPRWLNDRQLVYASGDPLFGDAERALYIADVVTGRTTRLRPDTGADDPIKLSDAWSPDGSTVIYQAAGTDTEIVMVRQDGSLLGRNNAVKFARYGMVAAWSPDGGRVAIGGTGGQCPYGVILFDRLFDSVAQANPPPSMCDPAWSPAGNLLAFTGVTPRATGAFDGRVDVYVVNSSGFGASNLTSNLRGTIDLLGWVGGR